MANQQKKPYPKEGMKQKTFQVPDSMLNFKATDFALDKVLDQDDRKFEGVTYSGGVINHPFWGNLAFDLSTTQGEENLAVLLNHDHDQIAGHAKLVVDSAMRVFGNLMGEEPAAQKIIRLAAKGFKWQMSVHIEPSEVQFLNKGESAVCNGKVVEGPGTIFRHNKIRESSFTPVGADGDTSAHVFSFSNGGIKMSKEIKTHNEDGTEKTAEQIAEEQKQIDADKAAKEAADKAEADRKAAEEVEKNKNPDGEKKFSQKDLDAANATIKELQAKVDKAEKEKADKKVAERTSALKKFGMADDEIKKFTSIPDEAFDSMVKHLETAESEKRKFSKNSTLFKDVAQGKADEGAGVNLMSAKSITEQADALVAKAKAEGRTLEFAAAVKQVKDSAATK